MNDYERDLFRYLLAWAPYGGPCAESLWTEYGVTLGRALQLAKSRYRIGEEFGANTEDRVLVRKVLAEEITLRRHQPTGTSPQREIA